MDPQHCSEGRLGVNFVNYVRRGEAPGERWIPVPWLLQDLPHQKLPEHPQAQIPSAPLPQLQLINRRTAKGLPTAADHSDINK
jgi:hypothetical protein